MSTGFLGVFISVVQLEHYWFYFITDEHLNFCRNS